MKFSMLTSLLYFNGALTTAFWTGRSCKGAKHRMSGRAKQELISALFVSTSRELDHEDENSLVYDPNISNQPLFADPALANTEPSPGTGDLYYLFQRLRAVAKSSIGDPQRITHTFLGMVSLLIGLFHIGYSLASSWVGPVSELEVILEGSIHLATGIAGVTRLDFNNENERARRALFLSVIPTNAAFFYLALTEAAQGTEAIVSLYHPALFLGYASMLAMVAWQLFEVYNAASEKKQLATGLFFPEPWLNVLATFLGNQVVVVFVLTAQTLPQMAGIDKDTFTTFVSSYPDFRFLIANQNLDIMAGNNVFMFLTTLLKYKAVNRPLLYTMGITLNAYLFYDIFTSAFNIAGGKAMQEWIGFCF